jgi:hypothetical protein
VRDFAVDDAAGITGNKRMFCRNLIIIPTCTVVTIFSNCGVRARIFISVSLQQF